MLLEPELLDAYAAAILSAARTDPDGLGTMPEEDARLGRFPMPRDERVENKRQEELLLLATIEDLLRHEISLREQTNEGPLLVFPSELTRDRPDAPSPELAAVVFTFEGPLLNIYSTLTVRLSRSGFFSKQSMWRSGADFTSRIGGQCRLSLVTLEEGRGQLELSFDRDTNEAVRLQFEDFVETHLTRRAAIGSVKRRRVFTCPTCETPLTDLQVERRRARGFKDIPCPVCEDVIISLLDREERLRPSSAVPTMDEAADKLRNRDTAAAILQGKIAADEFDVFLCHNTIDKPAARELGEALKARGIRPWLDEWALRPGLPWFEAIQGQLSRIKAAAVLVGTHGEGPWQAFEVQALLQQFVRRRCPVIPVILLGYEGKAELPPLLDGMKWVDLRSAQPDPIEQRIWGITGHQAR